MTDLFETISAADKAAFQDLMIYGTGAVLVKPDGTKEHVPFREIATHIPRARTHLPACNVLALDLGTHCGWATAKRDGAMEYGTESFHRLTGGNKWASFRAWLSMLIGKQGIEAVYFEDVKAHGPGQVLAAHAYGGFLAMAQMVCHQHNVRMIGVGVSTVKKAWTGKGNANKEAMIATARDKGFRLGKAEHDTADALAILSWAVKQEAV